MNMIPLQFYYYVDISIHKHILYDHVYLILFDDIYQLVLYILIYYEHTTFHF